MKKITTLAAAWILGLMFLNGGLNKFLEYMPMPEQMNPEMQKDFAAFVEISWLMPLVGIGEILGGILLLFPRFRALGAIVSFPILIGINAFCASVEPSGLALAIPLLLMEIYILITDREKIKPLF